MLNCHVFSVTEISYCFFAFVKESFAIVACGGGRWGLPAASCSQGTCRSTGMLAAQGHLHYPVLFGANDQCQYLVGFYLPDIWGLGPCIQDIFNKWLHSSSAGCSSGYCYVLCCSWAAYAYPILPFFLTFFCSQISFQVWSCTGLYRHFCQPCLRCCYKRAGLVLPKFLLASLSVI